MERAPPEPHAQARRPLSTERTPQLYLRSPCCIERTLLHIPTVPLRTASVQYRTDSATPFAESVLYCTDGTPPISLLSTASVQYRTDSLTLFAESVLYRTDATRAPRLSTASVHHRTDFATVFAVSVLYWTDATRPTALRSPASVQYRTDSATLFAASVLCRTDGLYANPNILRYPHEPTVARSIRFVGWA